MNLPFSVKTDSIETDIFMKEADGRALKKSSACRCLRR